MIYSEQANISRRKIQDFTENYNKSRLPELRDLLDNLARQSRERVRTYERSYRF